MRTEHARLQRWTFRLPWFGLGAVVLVLLLSVMLPRFLASYPIHMRCPRGLLDHDNHGRRCLCVLLAVSDRAGFSTDAARAVSEGCKNSGRRLCDQIRLSTAPLYPPHSCPKISLSHGTLRGSGWPRCLGRSIHHDLGMMSFDGVAVSPRRGLCPPLPYGPSLPGYLSNKDIMVGWSHGTGGGANDRERRCLRAPFPSQGEGRFS